MSKETIFTLVAEYDCQPPEYKRINSRTFEVVLLSQEPGAEATTWTIGANYDCDPVHIRVDAQTFKITLKRTTEVKIGDAKTKPVEVTKPDTKTTPVETKAERNHISWPLPCIGILPSGKQCNAIWDLGEWKDDCKNCDGGAKSKKIGQDLLIRNPTMTDKKWITSTNADLGPPLPFNVLTINQLTIGSMWHALSNETSK